MRRIHGVWRLWVLASVASAVVVLAGVPRILAEDDAKPKAESSPLRLLVDKAVQDGELSAEEQKKRQEAYQKQFQEMMKAAEEARKKEEEAMKKMLASPEWQPSHKQVHVIELDTTLHIFCITHDGKLLAGCGGSPSQIRVFTPDGKLLDRWNIDVKPQAIAALPDGTIFVAGDGRIARLDHTGKVLKTADAPAIAAKKIEAEKKEKEKAAKVVAKEDGEEKEKAEPSALFQSLGRALFGIGKPEPDIEEMLAARRKEINSVAATDQDIFVACSMTKGYGYAVWRVDHNFENPQQIISGLRGCCGQMDIHARNGELFVAENARKRVVRYDRQGKLLSKFGSGDRKKASGFGSCCNPMNLCFGSGNELYTSESGPPDVVKRFTVDGEFKNVVALPELKGGCVRVAVGVSPDEHRVYVMNTSTNAIHVFADKSAQPTPRVTPKPES